MSTSTTNYGFIKPAELEEVSALTLTQNMQKASYVLNRIKQSTAAEFNKKMLNTRKRTTATTALARTTDENTWSHATGSTWSDVAVVENGQLGESGSTLVSNSGYFVFIQPGYYRLQYQISVSPTTYGFAMGHVRAGIFYWDNINTGVERAIPYTFTAVPLSHNSGSTCLSLDTIIRVNEQNQTTNEVPCHAENTNTVFTTAGTPDWSYRLRFSQDNTSGYTVQLNAEETWMQLEFLRSM